MSAQREHTVLSLGGHDERVRTRLRSFQDEGFARRLWEKDPSLWKDDAEHRRIISDALGWLDLPSSMAPRVDGLSALVKDCAAAGYTDAVLLGMGGSSLAPEVMRKTFGVAEGALDLQVLDSTDPAAVLAVDRSLDLSQTVFLVSSKSGTTTETASFAAYFCDRARRMEGRGCGRHVVAITDAGTPLAEQAERDSFRALFVNPGDVGGRYSALSYFGLVPAALIGVDLRGLLESARRMAQACGPEVAAEENEALVLGAALGELALAGRDKLTLDRLAAHRVVRGLDRAARRRESGQGGQGHPAGRPRAARRARCVRRGPRLRASGPARPRGVAAGAPAGGARGGGAPGDHAHHGRPARAGR